ncbi:MAG: hypothetical protein HGB10_04165 [Coriobacteriia bacterium]|nr:hypothetical protein [Coriobacteriia bacterium]
MNLQRKQWFSVSLVVLALCVALALPVAAFGAPGMPHLRTWGSNGTGYGEFSSPWGLRIDPAGGVWVADLSNNRVQRFTANGTFVASYGTPGSGAGEFSGPSDVAFDSYGNFYVVDMYNNRVQKFSNDGGYLSSWGGYGSSAGLMMYPAAIAIDSSDNVYVVDTNNARVQKFDSSGNYLGEWGGFGAGNGQFTVPSGIAINAQNVIYVSDRAGNRIQKFNTSGTFLGKWGTSGAADGQFNGAWSVTLDQSGAVYVSDTYNYRLQKFTANGVFVMKTINGAGGLDTPVGIAATPAGNVLTTDVTDSDVKEFGVARQYVGGTVVYDGTVQANILVSAYNASTHAYVTAAMTKPSGQYCLSLPVGMYHIRFTSASSPSWNQYYNNSVAIGSAIEVDVVSGGYTAVSTDLRFNAPSTQRIFGQVRDHNYSGMGGVKVTVYNGETHAAVRSAYSDAGGYYSVSLSGLGPNYYHVGFSECSPASFNQYYGFDMGETSLESAAPLWVDYNWERDLWVNLQPIGAAASYVQHVSDGRLWVPEDVKRDSLGNVYVLNTQNHRIEKYDSNGTWLAQIGEHGFNDGQFRYPRAFTIDADDNILVADTSNSRIQKFNSSGAFVSVFAYVYAPAGVAVDAGGNVYAAAEDHNFVVKFDSSGTEIDSWGTYGGDPGSFNYPGQLVVDGDGHVLVCDRGNARVQEFTNDGTLLDVFGGSGTGTGQMITPTGIAVDTHGRVLVSDGPLNRVQVFTGDHEYEGVFGVYGGGAGEFHTPYGLSVDAAGNVWVADGENNRIEKLRLRLAAPSYVRTIGSYGYGDGQLNYPKGAAFDADGDIWVVDQDNSRVQKFSDTGTYTAQFGSWGESAGQFRVPGAIKVGSNGDLYVVDCWNHRVQQFHPDGTHVRSYGSLGYGGSGTLYYPTDVAVDGAGNVYVTDPNYSRIQKWDVNGTYLGQVGSWGSGEGYFQSPVGVAVDESDNLYAVDGSNYNIQKFSSSGAFVLRFGGYGSGYGNFELPQRIDVDSDGYIYVGDSYLKTVQKFFPDGVFATQFGSVGESNGYFNTPVGIDVDANGRILVADDNNQRIQMFATRESLSGRVTSGGTAQSHAVVSAFDAVTHAHVKGVFTDAEGYYDLGMLPIGEYHLRFTGTDPVELEQFYSHGVSISDAETLTVSAAGPLSVSADLVPFLVPPTISSFSPGSARVGTRITIAGSHFEDATSVSFGGVDVPWGTWISLTDSIIWADVPAGAVSGKITVTGPGGTAESAGTFNVIPAPTVSSFTPESGPVGTMVTITGADFVNVSGVQFNGTDAATYTVVGTGTIRATVAAGTTTGQISVSSAGGTGTSAADFTVTTAPLTQTISGVVSSEAGPMNRCVVTAFTADGHTFVKGVFTNANGEYSLSIPAGTYHLRFTGTTPSNLTQYYNHAVRITDAAIVSLDPGGAMTVSTNLSPQ